MIHAPQPAPALAAPHVALPGMSRHTRFAALCFRLTDRKVKILLVTTRGSGRWILPKGRPIPGMTPARSAAQEAWEEAGVIGHWHDRCLGVFTHVKDGARRPSAPSVCVAYPVRVLKLAGKYPERGQRKRKWFTREKAAEKVAHPELSRLLREFDPFCLPVTVCGLDLGLGADM